MLNPRFIMPNPIKFKSGYSYPTQAVFNNSYVKGDFKTAYQLLQNLPVESDSLSRISRASFLEEGYQAIIEALFNEQQNNRLSERALEKKLKYQTDSNIKPSINI